jgi:RNA polymerase sigma-70 factor (ECF subfamily)
MSDQSGRQSESAGLGTAVRAAAAELGSVNDLTSRGTLVERAQAGDRAAFEALLERWLEPAFRTALAILGSEADARDATQEAFLQAWRELRRLRDPERFDAWLGRILVNSCRGLRRGLRRRTVREISLDVVPGRDEPASGFDADWDEQPASLDALEHAFDRLKIRERTILVLHHLEHRPIAEIATVLGIPTGTAKSRLSTARHALERALEAELR